MKKIHAVMGFTLALASLTGAAVSSTAHAQERRIYSSDGCRGRGVGTGLDIWRGRTTNNDTVLRGVHCPIVRSRFDSTPDVSLWIKVVDQHPNENIECGFWTQNSDSFDGWNGYGIGRRTTDWGDHVQTLSYPAIRAHNANAFYTIECAVPGKFSTNKPSQIISYSTTES